VNKDSFAMGIQLYFKKLDQVIDSQADPLQFWKDNCSDYGMQAKLAKRTLTVEC
jgi:hypothetical protein